MDMNFVLKVLQSLALVASIAQTSLDVVRGVRELIREYRHHNGERKGMSKARVQPGFSIRNTWRCPQPS